MYDNHKHKDVAFIELLIQEDAKIIQHFSRGFLVTIPVPIPAAASAVV